MPSAVLAAEKEGRLDLGRLYPPLGKYCPLTYADEGLHRNGPQVLFLLLDCEEAFYGGAVGGGKSAALLMAALQYVDVPGYRALILRRTFAQLEKGDGLIPLSHEWLKGTDAVWNEQKHRWTFPSGATIEFGHVQDQRAMYDYQGGRWQFIGFDELTQFPFEPYEFIAFSRAARKTALADLGIPRRVRSTGNPGGIGHGWVKTRFVEKGEPGAVFIPARIRDNPGLDADDYEQGLSHLSEATRRQLMDGDWDVFEGAAYPELDEFVHAVPPLPLSTIAHWARHESMDYGVSNETVFHLYVTDYDGNIVVADEYAAADRVVRDHAAEVLERRAEWWEAREDGDPNGRPIRHVCWGDPSIAARTGSENRLGDPLSTKDLFREHGVAISQANNRRLAGYSKVRDLLQVDVARPFPAWHPRYGEHGAPRLFVVRDRCPGLWKNLMDAPIATAENDPERFLAVDRKWEGAYGHWHASARYGLLSPDRTSRVPEDPGPEDPRERVRWERVKRRQQEARDRARRRPSQDW